MKKVPKMLTSKDVLYLEDIFNWNIVASKKIDFFNSQIKDIQIQEMFTKIANMHYEICEDLVSILESGEEND